jgi:hypothetical protein
LPREEIEMYVFTHNDETRSIGIGELRRMSGQLLTAVANIEVTLNDGYCIGGEAQRLTNLQSHYRQAAAIATDEINHRETLVEGAWEGIERGLDAAMDLEVLSMDSFQRIREIIQGALDPEEEVLI